MIHKMADAIDDNSSSTPIHTKREQAVEGVFQVEITSAATVILQGRASEGAPWVDIDTFDETTDPPAKIVALFPDMRVTVSGNDGEVSAWLSEAEQA